MPDPTTPFTSDWCHGCKTEIESDYPTMHVPEGMVRGKGPVTCLRCGAVWGPFEVVPLEDWDQHGHNAFDQEKRN